MTKASRMFPFITCTWNPVGGKCPYGCVYCWAQGTKGLVEKYDMAKYRESAFIVEKELRRKFKEDDFVFVGDMRDLFSPEIPPLIINRVLGRINQFFKTRFLLLTKNPNRYLEYLPFFLPVRWHPNIILGATIESDRNFPDLSNAPSQFDRLYWMTTLPEHLKTFVSIEPILDFDLEIFETSIYRIKPWAVAVGYDNYCNKLPEPSLEKTLQLIERMEKYTTVYRKTLRKAWWE